MGPAPQRADVSATVEPTAKAVLVGVQAPPRRRVKLMDNQLMDNQYFAGWRPSVHENQRGGALVGQCEPSLREFDSDECSQKSHHIECPIHQTDWIDRA